MIRLAIVAVCFVALSGAIVGRMVYVNINDRDFLQEQGDLRTIRLERINAHRGMIRDRLGKPLAISSPVVSLWANPNELLSSSSDLNQLATMLKVDPEEFADRLENSRSRSFVYLRRHMPPPEAEKILSLSLPGLYSEKEYHRFYPAGEVAAHLVGVTNIDDRGQEGVELAFDQWLTGVPGKKKVLKNLYGDIVADIMPVADAVPGRDIELAMDLRLQYLAYRELKAAIQRHEAQSGSIIVLDVASGSVLAMANQPSYNPNNRQRLDIATVRNRAVTDAFEPGSTLKPFTVAVALESGSHHPLSRIDTSPGFVRVDDKTIPDPRDMGELNLGDILAHSSQVGISKLALTLDPFAVRDLLADVGIGQIPGSGFPGESQGYLPNHRRWTDIERATLAYGYGVTTTPLQLANAYLAIARGGVRKQITLLAEEQTSTIRVMSEQTASQLTRMLAKVVSDGTGGQAHIQGYTVAGKTGTVRKLGESGYEDTRHLAFFAGFAPVQDPELVAVVMINDPAGDANGGGSVAAPVFGSVMSGAMRILKVAPDQQVAMSKGGGDAHG
ncbi:MAG: cell division protein [OM182 bacterium MED-G24]|uniref:Peptidoglycan D,D-transpeptidase FtsI n=1 Tax=OM182 bacterium MED-G24 TaxID=1986255 RepID=A0A2A5WS03_9GAMM|nr:MAG: cell division protein [OM182 bacterium MED-G24]